MKLFQMLAVGLVAVAFSYFPGVQCTRDLVLRDLGCWLDTANRAIPSIDNHLDGAYTTRPDAIQQCAKLARGLGYTVFAVQNGGWCASGPNAKYTYKQYGSSGACKSDGKGGPWGNQVYEIETVYQVEYKSLGCYGDKSSRAIPPIEGTFVDLHGAYTKRADAIAKCARSAAALGYRVFAVQNGGWCASSANAGVTYKKYGASKACLSGGKGGPWANQVYEIEEVEKISLIRYGCYKDTSNRALKLHNIPGFDEPYSVEQCVRYVNSVLGYNLAGVQDGRQCTAGGVFNKHGTSNVCKKNSRGGSWANEVFGFTVKRVY